MKKILILSLSFIASSAFADELSVREENPWTLNVGEEISYVVPLTRLELSYNVSDAAYLSLSTEIGPENDGDRGWLTYTSLGAYGHVVKSKNSGHSLLVGGQVKVGIGQYSENSLTLFAGETDIGWEYRSRGGFLIRAFIGNAFGYEWSTAAPNNGGFYVFCPITRIQLGWAF